MQRVIIGAAILLVDDGGRIVVDHQPIVQQRPPYTPVTVRKGVDILKASVEVRPCLQWRFRADGVDLFDQLRKVVLYLVGR